MVGLRLDKKEELIERIMRGIESNIISYEDFLLGLAKDAIESYDDEELLNWINPEDRKEYIAHVTTDREE